MATAIETLPVETQEKITAVTFDEFDAQHMPIHIFGDEMNDKSNLLSEHAGLYLDRLSYDVAPLAGEIKSVSQALQLQEDIWSEGEIRRDSTTRFWYDNKKRLYDLNQELSKRLPFQFKQLNMDHAAATIKSLGTSDDDTDAVDDGRHIKKVLNETKDTIAGGIYSQEEIEEFVDFYEKIEQARSIAVLDRTAPHEDRILRDKIYLYLRDLEAEVYEAADACFVKEPEQRRRYVSAFLRKRHKKYDAKRNR